VRLRPKVPVEVRAVADRRLAWGLTTDGVALVASPTCLHVNGEQVPWWQVERVGWADPTLRIVGRSHGYLRGAETRGLLEDSGRSGA